MNNLENLEKKDIKAFEIKCLNKTSIYDEFLNKIPRFFKPINNASFNKIRYEVKYLKYFPQTKNNQKNFSNFCELCNDYGHKIDSCQKIFSYNKSNENETILSNNDIKSFENELKNNGKKFFEKYGKQRPYLALKKTFDNMANNFSNGKYNNLCNYNSKNFNKTKNLENKKNDNPPKIYSDNLDQEIKSDTKIILNNRNLFQTNKKIFSFGNNQNEMTPLLSNHPFSKI